MEDSMEIIEEMLNSDEELIDTLEKEQFDQKRRIETELASQMFRTQKDENLGNNNRYDQNLQELEQIEKQLQIYQRLRSQKKHDQNTRKEYTNQEDSLHPIEQQIKRRQVQFQQQQQKIHRDQENDKSIALGLGKKMLDNIQRRVRNIPKNESMSNIREPTLVSSQGQSSLHLTDLGRDDSNTTYLNKLLRKNEKASSQSERLLEEQLALETDVYIKNLQKDLDHDRNEKRDVLLKKYQDKKRKIESEIKAKIDHDLEMEKNEKANQLFQLEENLVTTTKKKIIENHEKELEIALDKLHRALKIGSNNCLTQLKNQLEKELEEKKKQASIDAEEALEREKEAIRVRYQKEHDETLRNLNNETEQEHRTILFNIESQLREDYEEKVKLLTARISTEKLRQTEDMKQRLMDDHAEKIKSIEQSYQSDLSNELLTLECETKLKMEQELFILKNNKKSKLKRDLQDKKEFFVKKTTSLLRNLENLIDECSNKSDVQKNLKNKNAVERCLSQYKDLHDENMRLIDKVAEFSKDLILLKKENEANSDKNSLLQHQVATLMETNKTQEVMCKRLYMANEALVKKVEH